MPTCHKRKCPRCHNALYIDSNITCFNPHFFGLTCHSPFIHSKLQNIIHCMESANNPSYHSDDEEKESVNVKLIQCPYLPPDTQEADAQTSNDTRTCCVRSRESKADGQKDLLQGFKAHISVDIGNGVQSFTNEEPQLRKSISAHDNHEDATQKSEMCPKECCAKSKTSITKFENTKLSSQGIIKRIEPKANPTVKSLDRVLSSQSQSDAEPCCANAYTKFKPPPILPAKGISGTARPGYVVNNSSREMIPKETASECMTNGGCVHGIASIMPQVAQPVGKTRSPCCCGVKETQACDTTLASDNKKCQCKYPPGFSEFSCAGNITGVCKCSDEFH